MTTKRGLTIVEVMVIVAIIGVLTAIALPAFVRFQKKCIQRSVDTRYLICDGDGFHCVPDPQHSFCTRWE